MSASELNSGRDASPEEKAVSIVDEIFAKFDADGNGVIDQQEFRQVVLSVMKKYHYTKVDPSNEEVERLFYKVDENKDGKITREEATRFVLN